MCLYLPFKKDPKSKTVKIVKIEPIRYNSWGSVIREGFNDQRRRCIGNLYQKPDNTIYVKQDNRTHSRYRNPSGLKQESWRFNSILGVYLDEFEENKYYNLFDNHIFETKLKLSRFWFFEIDAWGKRTTK